MTRIGLHWTPKKLPQPPLPPEASIHVSSADTGLQLLLLSQISFTFIFPWSVLIRSVSPERSTASLFILKSQLSLVGQLTRNL